MVYNNAPLPTWGLKAADIRDTLSAGGGIVSNDTTSFFQPDANINIWSRYKPLENEGAPKFQLAFDASDTLYYDPDWWKGLNENCGIYVPRTTGSSISVFLAKVQSEGAAWTYLGPQGGESSPYRLGDFCGYFKDAVCPLNGNLQDDYWIESPTGKLTFTFDFDANMDSTYNLMFDDIKLSTIGDGLTKLTDFYLGVLAWRDGTNGAYIYPTSTTKLGTDSVTFTLDGLTGNTYWGEWNAMPYLSSAVQTLEGSEQAATYATLNIEPKKIYIHGPGTLVIVITLACWEDYYNNLRSIYYSVHAKNSNSAPVTVDLELQVRRVPKSSNLANGSEGELAGPLVTVTDVEIPANTEITLISSNYPDVSNLTNYRIISSGLTLNSDRDDSDTGYDYWVGSSAKGYATTWMQIDIGDAPEGE